MNNGDKTVYQYGSFEPTFDSSYISLDNTFKNIFCYAFALVDEENRDPTLARIPKHFEMHLS
jgi:hypothetical protein